MAAKKTAKSASKSAAKKTPAKKSAVKSTKRPAATDSATAEAASSEAAAAAVPAAPPKPKSPGSAKPVRPPLEAVARAAYLIYRRRVELGLPGDSHGDWLQAERELAGTGVES